MLSKMVARNFGASIDIAPKIIPKRIKINASVTDTVLTTNLPNLISLKNIIFIILSKIKENYVTQYLKPYLLYPHNGEIVAKIVKLISSKYFQNNKERFFNI